MKIRRISKSAAAAVPRCQAGATGSRISRTGSFGVAFTARAPFRMKGLHRSKWCKVRNLTVGTGVQPLHPVQVPCRELERAPSCRGRKGPGMIIAQSLLLHRGKIPFQPLHEAQHRECSAGDDRHVGAR